MALGQRLLRHDRAAPRLGRRHRERGRGRLPEGARGGRAPRARRAGGRRRLPGAEAAARGGQAGALPRARHTGASARTSSTASRSTPKASPSWQSSTRAARTRRSTSTSARSSCSPSASARCRRTSRPPTSRGRGRSRSRSCASAKRRRTCAAARPCPTERRSAGRSRGILARRSGSRNAAPSMWPSGDSGRDVPWLRKLTVCRFKIGKNADPEAFEKSIAAAVSLQKKAGPTRIGQLSGYRLLRGDTAGTERTYLLELEGLMSLPARNR